MRLISIDLHKASNEDIREFCEKISLGKEGAEELLDDKLSGFGTFFLEITSKVKLVAFTKTTNLKKIHFKDTEMEKIYKNRLDEFNKYVDSTHTVKKENKFEANLNLTVDDILDKINEFGIESISKEELKILEKF